jgi:hypothetical protein
MLEKLIGKYKKAGILLDTNLLLLYLIGLYDLNFIRQFKRTCMYDKNDFIWMHKFLTRFDNIFITPQVLGEVWNFAEKIHGKRLNAFIETAIKNLLVVTENYVEKNILLQEDSFFYVGVTDTSIICSAKKLNCLVITDDLRAYSYYVANGVDTININHLREI